MIWEAGSQASRFPTGLVCILQKLQEEEYSGVVSRNITPEFMTGCPGDQEPFHKLPHRPVLHPH